MSFDSISGTFYIADQAIPAQFAPATWEIWSNNPENATLTNPSEEYAVRFQSVAPDEGSITGFATYMRDENEAVYALRLKSLLEMESDGVR